MKHELCTGILKREIRIFVGLAQQWKYKASMINVKILKLASLLLVHAPDKRSKFKHWLSLHLKLYLVSVQSAL